ncbi:MAG: DUF4065 domain-containing protein [Muribaculaceae bacterium]|nr:DUF4065 domain-containing protein [Muribaculaceae bacterium]
MKKNIFINIFAKKVYVMITMVDIQDIAKYTILRLIQNGDSICPLKLQKVLYYMQAWHMVYFGKENTLFEDIPQAWVNGPVYRTVYDTYKHIPMYNQFNIEDIGVKQTGEEIEILLSTEAEKQRANLNITEEQNKFIESIYDHYGAMEHDRLVFLTHSELPWSEQREGLLPFEHSEKEIPLNTMFEYYNQRMLRNRAKEQ